MSKNTLSGTMYGATWSVDSTKPNDPISDMTIHYDPPVTESPQRYVYYQRLKVYEEAGKLGPGGAKILITALDDERLLEILRDLDQ